MFGSLEHPLAPISRTPPTRRTQRTENFFMTIGCRFYKESSTVDSDVKYTLNQADTNGQNTSSPVIFQPGRRYRSGKTEGGRSARNPVSSSALSKAPSAYPPQLRGSDVCHDSDGLMSATN